MTVYLIDRGVFEAIITVFIGDTEENHQQPTLQNCNPDTIQQCNVTKLKRKKIS
jgi:hypothetical protein